jgi:hypothetical protein
MLSRDQIILDVLDSLFNSMLQYSEEVGLEVGDHDITQAFMAMYIRDKAKNLSDEELLTAFGDPVQVVSEYVEYIQGILERSDKPVS